MFTDLGAGNSYNSSGGWTVAGPGPIGEWGPASLFTAAIGGAVSQIDVGLSVIDDGDVSVSLWTDVGGLPGVELESWSATATQSFGDCCAVVTLAGLAGPNLTAGQQYFLAIIPGETTFAVWNENNQGVDGTVVSSSDGGATWPYQQSGTLGAFDILGGSASVPEPGTVLLLGAGLLCLVARARKRAVR
jgi:hypothetical protein